MLTALRRLHAAVRRDGRVELPPERRAEDSAEIISFAEKDHMVTSPSSMFFLVPNEGNQSVFVSEASLWLYLRVLPAPPPSPPLAPPPAPPTPRRKTRTVSLKLYHQASGVSGAWRLQERQRDGERGRGQQGYGGGARRQQQQQGGHRRLSVDVRCDGCEREGVVLVLLESELQPRPPETQPRPPKPQSRPPDPQKNPSQKPQNSMDSRYAKNSQNHQNHQNFPDSLKPFSLDPQNPSLDSRYSQNIQNSPNPSLNSPDSLKSFSQKSQNSPDPQNPSQNSQNPSPDTQTSPDSRDSLRPFSSDSQNPSQNSPDPQNFQNPFQNSQNPSQTSPDSLRPFSLDSQNSPDSQNHQNPSQNHQNPSQTSPDSLRPFSLNSRDSQNHQNPSQNSQNPSQTSPDSLRPFSRDPQNHQNPSQTSQTSPDSLRPFSLDPQHSRGLQNPFQNHQYPSQTSPDPQTSPDSLRPFLSVHTRPADSSHRIRKRGLDCDDGDRTGLCCRRQFFMDFRLIGWSDWIIAPSGYLGNYCEGRCPAHMAGVPSSVSSFHTAVLNQYRLRGLGAGASTSCCIPTKLAPMSMLYFDDEYNIVKRDVPNMVVEECGSRIYKVLQTNEASDPDQDPDPNPDYMIQTKTQTQTRLSSSPDQDPDLDPDPELDPNPDPDPHQSKCTRLILDLCETSEVKVCGESETCWSLDPDPDLDPNLDPFQTRLRVC
ncbi:hypothetical protein WMY93_032548 [Mugilogobius chulae]|uniref:TGF-beta family profile domain-containing protein n=1 Tax=Mugilogobius chulae TaxID=88201 RepID=A0AAW0MQI9_9GOBI